MPKSVNFSIVIHDHQPTGNFDHVMASSYDDAYRPFLEVLERFPAVRIGLHLSGCLLDWIQANRPEFVDRIAGLVERGQVELLTGGYYEPILTMLPERDRLGQIEMMRDHLRKRFGVEARGMWLAERVWEQNLASSLARAGVGYTFVDDTHFLHAGLKEDDLTGFYITEDQGRILRVFPIAEKLRYTIPFREPAETIEYLAEFADEEGNNIMLYGDDGEKFGVWPKTNEHVYGDRWLERFFTALTENASWINIITPAEAVEKLPPKGRIYLPDASYREMTEWALPTQSREDFERVMAMVKEDPRLAPAKRFLKGGFWRNFKAKYEEANELYAKMMLVSGKVDALPHDSQEYIEARKRLYEGQCNCPYWHGVFGGLYLPHLRSAVYGHLIAAEAIADKARAGEDPQNIEMRDCTFDGRDEIIVQTGMLNYTISPSKGGQIVELDVVEKGFNLLMTLNRRLETYHEKLTSPGEKKSTGPASIHDSTQSKEEGLDKILFYDKYPRKSLVDHILGSEATAEKFLRAELDELADFSRAEYKADTGGEALGPVTLTSRREGKSGGNYNLEIEKRLTFAEPGSMLVAYRLTNHAQVEASFRLGVEFNLAMLAGNAPDRYYFTSETDNAGKLSAINAFPSLQSIGVADEWSGIRVNIATKRPVEVWTCPVETVSVSEGGFERLYQSSAIMLLWDVKLEPGAAWEGDLVHRVTLT